jgi:hypothetical protein
MRRAFLVVMFAGMCGGRDAEAQRLDDARVGAATSAPERSAGRKNWIVVQRTLWSAGVATLALVPGAFVIAAEPGSPAHDAAPVIVAATATAYFAGIVIPAVTIAAERCSAGRRIVRSLTGAVAGGAVGAATGALMHRIGKKDLPAVIGVSSGILGAPLGSAVALRRCD